MKRGMALVTLCVALGMVLPAYGMLGNETPENDGASLPHWVTPITPSTIPKPVSTEKREVPLTLTPMLAPLDIPAATTEYDDIHPALALSSSGGLFGAYTIYQSLMEQDIAFLYSSDQGQSWDDMGYYSIEGVQDYPAIDYWRGENSFVGTFTPDPSDFDGSAQYLLRVGEPTDPDTWELVYWDWTTYGQRDRESADIAGYDDVGDATWWYGVIASTEGSDYEGETHEHVPVFNFPDYTASDSGWGWWWPEYDNAAHACVDIDRSSGMMYAAWDQYNESRESQGRDILLAIADVHDWWEENWVMNWYYLGGEEDNTYPDIAAENGYIYIVLQADIMIPGKQDIICYYSHDGGTTWETSTIAADPAVDEQYPSIIAYGEGASCIFVLDGNLYVSHTDDGGVTWSEPVMINDESGTVYEEYRTAHIAHSGHTLWTDTRSGDADIYYDGAGLPPTPILSIQEITGGFGAKATVANVGTADAENVAWSIVFDGLVFLGKEKSGTVTIPAGEEVTLKTGLVLGIGPVTITATAADATKTANGFVLGPLVLGVS